MNHQEHNKTPGREFALKFLFQLFIKENLALKESFLQSNVDKEALEEKLIEFKESYLRPDEEHSDNQIDDGNFFFACKLVRGISLHMSRLEELIKAETKRESLDNIEKIERCVLLVGAEELFYFDTPYQVVLNELVGLAKKYGGENSGRFVNGVLDGIRGKKN
ncbi:MAG: transcription antitermination factor NusB [Bacteriovoracaceae bacterium]|nr:transcription antitermination factor NusB [Bacteriovoracaceae bacterium]